MQITQKAYDAKLLAKRLEVLVGRPISNYAASTAVNVILKWIEKSARISESKIDDTLLALYPALISFLSKKIDLKEFKGEIEVEKAYDIQELLKGLEVYGLVVAEEAANEAVEVCLMWIIESASISETPYDDIVTAVIPVVMKPLSDLINGISEEVETELDIESDKEVEE